MTSSVTSEGDTSKPDGDSQVDISLLKELARRSLVDALNAVHGAKTLVLEPELAGPLGLVTEVSLLKQHGVDKMFWLEAGPLNASTSNIVYLCRPLIKYIKIIAEQIKKHTAAAEKHTYTLLLTPRTSTLVSRILEEEGVLGEITISSYDLQFIPLEDDLISLENDNSFKEIWVDGDETVIYNSAQALLTLQRLYGLFPRVIGKGDHAAKLANLLIRLTKQQAPSPDSLALQTPSEKFDSIIIIDRKVDMITPLLTQLTYEGLVDELIGIKNSHALLPAALSAAPSANPTSPIGTAASLASSAPTLEKKKKYHLSASADPLFSELRDNNFAIVGTKLNAVARRLENDYKARHQAKTTAQLREFVGRLGGLQTEHQSLRLHTGLAEILQPLTRTEQFNRSLEIQQNLLASFDVPAQLSSLEELLAQGADVRVVLRLLCLASITSGGIKNKTLENIKRDFLQTYGYAHLSTLLHLSAISLLHQSSPIPPENASSKIPLATLRKQLRLLVDDVSEAQPTDISYVYSGYAPLSIRLVQCVSQKGAVLASYLGTETERGDESKSGKAPKVPKVSAHPIVGWKGFEDVVSTIPGETIDIVQNGGMPTASAPPSVLPRDHTTTTVVFFLGGCTFTEIAALRWMSQQSRGRNFLIATTGIVSGNTLMECLYPPGVVKDAPINAT